MSRTSSASLRTVGDRPGSQAAAYGPIRRGWPNEWLNGDLHHDIATPAGAATAPTARLKQGTVTVTGTTARDVIDVRLDADRLAVDLGFDGTVDAQFPMSRVKRLSVLIGDGDDGVTVQGTGVGDLPITISAGAGNDGGGVVGNIGDSGPGDAPVTIHGDDGNDNLIAAAPGPVTVDAGAGDDRVDGGGAGIGQQTIAC